MAHVDMMVIDLRLADTRGDVVFELAAATHPELRSRTLFMTGDISERAQRLIESCKCPYLRKPFAIREFLTQLEALRASSHLDTDRPALQA
jgi:DNA-binding response OmpR family regulator